MRRLCLIVLGWLLVAVSRTWAHGGAIHHADEVKAEAVGPRDWHELARSWGTEAGTVIPLVLSVVLYAIGLRRMWKRAGVGHGIQVREAWLFAGGMFALFVALVSPLHPWGSVLFSAHMAQHEILMLAAAPLLVLSKPVVAFLSAVPPTWARRLSAFSHTGWFRAVWPVVINPFVAWLIHAIILWAWHIPVLFQATLTSEWVHALQHLSFLLSALLFWWAVIHGHARAAAFGAGVLYMFTTAVHSGLLGALLTFARTVWYPAYAETAPSWGMTALEDQQVGGLIMWVPACVVYIIAGLVLFAGWLRSSEERVRRRETQTT